MPGEEGKKYWRAVCQVARSDVVRRFSIWCGCDMLQVIPKDGQRWQWQLGQALKAAPKAGEGRKASQAGNRPRRSKGISMSACRPFRGGRDTCPAGAGARLRVRWHELRSVGTGRHRLRRQELGGLSLGSLFVWVFELKNDRMTWWLRRGELGRFMQARMGVQRVTGSLYNALLGVMLLCGTTPFLVKNSAVNDEVTENPHFSTGHTVQQNHAIEGTTR